MLGGYLEFFMKPTLAETYLSLKRELDELIQNKVSGWELHIFPCNFIPYCCFHQATTYSQQTCKVLFANIVS